MKTARTDNLLIILSFAILALSPLACGQGENPDGPSTGLCEGICAKFELCDSSTDESDCVEECQQDQALSASYWTGLANCVEDTSCDRMTSELLNDCVGDEVSLYHSTSKTAQGACETMARTYEVCNEDLDEAGVLKSCLQNTAAYFSDNLMNALEVCFFGSCDQINGCVLRTLDNYDADDLYDFFLQSLGVTGDDSGGGVEDPNDNVCDVALDLLSDSITRRCQENFSWCCYCICWNANMYVADQNDEHCYCGEPVGGQVKMVLVGECEGEALSWAEDLLENQSQDAEASGYLGQQCSSGNCGPAEFECACGGCINADYVCDGDPDCKWECGESISSDEEGCS